MLKMVTDFSLFVSMINLKSLIVLSSDIPASALSHLYLPLEKAKNGSHKSCRVTLLPDKQECRHVLLKSYRAGNHHPRLRKSFVPRLLDNISDNTKMCTIFFFFFFFTR